MGWGCCHTILSLQSPEQLPTKQTTTSWIRFSSDSLSPLKSSRAIPDATCKVREDIRKREGLFDGMEDAERKFMVENCSILGRKWLLIIPYYPSLVFDNAFILTNLHDRTLISHSNHSTCPVCHQHDRLGHEGLRPGRRPHYYARHNGVPPFSTRPSKGYPTAS